MEEQRPDSSFIKRQRWSGLWNGVVIGMGISWLLIPNLVGVIPLIIGIGLEYMQRKRLSREQER